MTTPEIKHKIELSSKTKTVFLILELSNLFDVLTWSAPADIFLCLSSDIVNQGCLKAFMTDYYSFS